MKMLTLDQLVLFANAAHAYVIVEHKFSMDETMRLTFTNGAVALIQHIHNKDINKLLSHINSITFDSSGTSIAGNIYTDKYIRLWFQLMDCTPDTAEIVLYKSLACNIEARKAALEMFHNCILEEGMTEAVNNEDVLRQLREANLHRLCSKIELVRATIKEIEHITEQGILE